MSVITAAERAEMSLLRSCFFIPQRPVGNCCPPLNYPELFQEALGCGPIH